jgi:hypothetical protein
MEEGAVMMVGLDPKRILDAMKVLDTQPAGARIGHSRMVADYDAVECVGKGGPHHCELRQLRESGDLAKG